MAVTEIMQKTDGVFMATAAVNFNYEWKFLATTEGSFIEQVFYYTAASMTATATRNGQTKSRTYNPGTETRLGVLHREEHARQRRAGRRRGRGTRDVQAGRHRPEGPSS